MAAPTQALPSWLTYSSSIITDAVGDPISTSVTILTLPLTYYGPSVPLGTDGVWTYGGLTPPASTATSLTTATPSSAISTSSSALSSATSTTSSPSTSSSSSSSFSSSSSSSSSSSTTIPTASASPSSASHRFPRGLIGAIVGSIVGALLLLLLLLLCLRWRTRRRAQYRHSTPIWTGWEIVDPSTVVGGGAAANTQGRPREVPDRVAGEGSPRHSGEEHDPFLSRRSDAPTTNGGATAMSPEMLQIMKELGPGVRLVSRPGAPAAARATATARRREAGMRSDEEDEDGAGEFGRRRSVFYLDPETGDAFWGNTGDYTPSNSGSSKPSMGRQILSPEEQYKIESESDRSREHSSDHQRQPAKQDSPLLPPPPLNPDGLSMPARKSSSRTVGSMDSARDEPDERAQLLTARRVRVTDLPSPPLSPSGGEDISAGPSSWVGLGGLARLRRLSWFKRESSPLRSGATMSEHSKSQSRPVSYSANPLSDEDVEAGRALLRAEMGVRADKDGRPISTVSGKSAVSGGSVYHDAASRPATPGQAPAGSFPSSYRTAQTHPQSSQNSRPSMPPAYEREEVPPLPMQTHVQTEVHGQEPSDASETQVNPSTATSSLHHDVPPGVDVLDMPVPSSVSPFSTASTRARKETPFPPGLGHLPNHWDNAQTPTDESVVNLDDHSPPVTIDILEQEPPRAGEGWRTLASGALGGNGDRRTTFGSANNPTIVHPRDITRSEQGSLHSMRSHLSPFSSRSPTGSAPASSRHLHFGSGSSSSRPSGHSQALSGSSGGASLAHSGSISSDGRRRGRRDASEISSPPPAYGRISVGATGRGAASPLYRSTASPQPHASDDLAVVSSTVTSTGTGSSGSSYLRMTDPATGAIMHFPTVPWTGAESDWPADAWIEMPGGGGQRWMGPPSRWRAMQARVGEAGDE